MALLRGSSRLSNPSRQGRRVPPARRAECRSRRSPCPDRDVLAQRERRHERLLRRTFGRHGDSRVAAGRVASRRRVGSTNCPPDVVTVHRPTTTESFSRARIVSQREPSHRPLAAERPQSSRDGAARRRAAARMGTRCRRRLAGLRTGGMPSASPPSIPRLSGSCCSQRRYATVSMCRISA